MKPFIPIHRLFLALMLTLVLVPTSQAQLENPNLKIDFGGLTGTGAPDHANLVKTKVVVDPVDDDPSIIRIGMTYTIADDWYIYGKNPKVGEATVFEISVPDGMTLGPIEYPPHHKFDKTLGNPEYIKEVTLWRTLSVQQAFETPITLEWTSSWQVCNDVCIPQEASGTYDLTLLPKVSEIAPEVENDEMMPILSEEEQRSLLSFMLFAFLGGLILNIMPCVLPVIGIKIMGFVQHAGESRAYLRTLGWAYTFGVLVSFKALALTIILIQKIANVELGQGFQFQNLPFVVTMTCLIFVMALSMLGVFSVNLGSGVTDASHQLSQKQGLAGAFFNGFLATLLSTPCSAPLLAPAVGYAFSQPPFILFVIFFFVGLGLAAPFLLLAYQPVWVKFLPKPGAWMETFKQVMGFIMLITSIAGLYVINAFRGAGGILWMLILFSALAVGCWMIGTFHGPLSSARSRLITKVLVVAILIGGWITVLEGKLEWRNEEYILPDSGESNEPVAWQSFLEGALDDALPTDKVIFVDATADWCGNCKVNEKLVLYSDAILPLLNDPNTIPVKADWTRKGPEILAYMKKFNRAAVPMYVVYGKDRARPQLLPTTLTRDIVRDAIQQAQQSFGRDLPSGPTN